MVRLEIKDKTKDVRFNPDNVTATVLTSTKFLVNTVDNPEPLTYDIPGEIIYENAKKFIADVSRGRRR